MLKSNDGLVEILIGPDLGNVIFPPLAWSVINVPSRGVEANHMFDNLYNSPTSHHICLTVHQQRKKDKIKSLVNLQLAEERGWKFLDTVSVLYQKPSSSSNNGFLPIAETANLFFKGDTPDTATTGWFNDEVGNATNFWDVDAVDGVDSKDDKTYYQKFSSQLNLILMSMCRPLEYRKFAYLCDVDKHELRRIHNFCKSFNITVCLFTDSDIDAKAMIEQVNNY